MLYEVITHTPRLQCHLFGAVNDGTITVFGSNRIDLQWFFGRILKKRRGFDRNFEFGTSRAGINTSDTHRHALRIIIVFYFKLFDQSTIAA